MSLSPIAIAQAERPETEPGLTRRHRTALAVATGLTILAVPSPAAAEGGWNSYVANIPDLFESRRWQDNNTDSVKTSITIGACEADVFGTPPNYTGVELRRNVVGGPDASYGTKNVTACLSVTTTGTWSDQTAGEYFFRFKTGASWNRLWASPVNAKY